MEKTETMKHTKEPWIADLRSGCCAIYPENRTEESEGCHRDDDRNICFSSKGSHFIESQSGSYWDMDDQVQVDFTRIVACVNACADVEDEKLSLGYVKRLKEENAQLRAQLRWRPVSEKPKKGKEVILSYVDCYGHRINVLGSYVRRFDEEAVSTDDEDIMEYSDEKDEYYLKEGWYEHTTHSDYDYWLLHEKIDKWLPIPPQGE